MNYCPIIWNRVTAFYFRETQVTRDGLYPDRLQRGSNVFQEVIHPVGRTHETLHPRTFFLSTKTPLDVVVVYYESLNPELKTKPRNECRFDERLQTRVVVGVLVLFGIF